MSRVRGASAPTSGAQDHGGLDERALDEALSAVAARARHWAETPPARRAELLARVVADTHDVADAWSAAGCAAKGYDPLSGEGGEELFSGVGTFLRLAQALRTSMLDLARVGRPRYPGPVKHRPGNRLSVQVMPASTFDKILYARQTGEIWTQPGVDEAQLQAGQALVYRDPLAHAGVALVLGAGNVGSLGPRDVLHKLFAEGKVVVLKANPVNDYLVEYWEHALAALIDEGVLRVVRGGAQVGAYLTGHDLVDEIHVTGSDKTHDAIVFGVGDEGARRKARDERLITKPVSCELGSVSPVVIVPGDWSEREIEYQARHVASMIANNAGFNCLTPRVLVTSAHWAQRAKFLDALEGVFATLAPRRAYYPGAASRRDEFLAQHPEARQIGVAGDGEMPWTLIRDVDATNPDDICFNVEAFCALTSETALESASPADFLDEATTFCNERLWGTLSMTILCDPRTMKRPDVATALERAVADLRYGSIGVNLWHAMSFAFATTAWGAYPGHPVTDIQSGSGFVGNTYLFSSVEKSVVRGPFVVSPAPSWFATNRHAHATLRKLLDFEAAPSWRKVPALLRAAMTK
ncbi:MAG: aldehyde dehydrogenase family protein [Acidobacteriota bacterium]|nr:aldehyde dehydrogenase family protein [Acidobacteriota bacterium]